MGERFVPEGADASEQVPQADGDKHRGLMKDPRAFCRQILPHVSRTFALTVPVLPSPLEDAVCCAYLLCRIADTVEDRHDLAPPVRSRLYDLITESLGDPAAAARFADAWPAVDDPHLQTLMLGTPDVIRAYGTLDEPTRAAVRDCVVEMVDGMRLSPAPQPGTIVYVCEDLAGLERYCHYVAGTVGLMLTRLFNERLSSPLDAAQGHRFGLGLQLTNILKDHRSDIERGTCFIPRPWLDAQGHIEPARRRQLVERTLEHLREANQYTLSIPAEEEGMRLFCLWAMWMAVATMREVGKNRTKISRLEVARLVAESRARVRDDEALQQAFQRLWQEAWPSVAAC